MELEDLKSAVSNRLIVDFDFSEDDATKAIDASERNAPHLWTEKAEPVELAKFLAEEDDDE
jgi:hypothetical protein